MKECDCCESFFHGKKDMNFELTSFKAKFMFKWDWQQNLQNVFKIYSKLVLVCKNITIFHTTKSKGTQIFDYVTVKENHKFVKRDVKMSFQRNRLIFRNFNVISNLYHCNIWRNVWLMCSFSIYFSCLLSLSHSVYLPTSLSIPIHLLGIWHFGIDISKKKYWWPNMLV